MEWTPEARKSNAYAWLTGERLHYSRGVDKQTVQGLSRAPNLLACVWSSRNEPRRALSSCHPGHSFALCGSLSCVHCKFNIAHSCQVSEDDSCFGLVWSSTLRPAVRQNTRLKTTISYAARQHRHTTGKTAWSLGRRWCTCDWSLRPRWRPR